MLQTTSMYLNITKLLTHFSHNGKVVVRNVFITEDLDMIFFLNFSFICITYCQ